MKIKGQAAMEYLMTYGWAILIVIIVAAALFALGVFNPTAWTGKQATGFGGLGTPIDWEVQPDGTFNLHLQNTQAGATVTINNVTATLGSTSQTWTTYNYDDANHHLTIGPGGDINLATLVGTANPYSINLGAQSTGSSYSIEVTVFYLIPGSSYVSTAVGTLTGSVSS
ncbi:MAG: hypothetical protein V1693_04530 [Nanoarchaeota archaeon]|nr:hypothetical protein [Nanoarchaeota archaeon]